MDKALLRTTYAANAASLATLFTEALAEIKVGAHKVEMTAPQASTGKGTQALQHIRLVPPDEAAGRVYVVGNANRVDQRAELRTLEYVDSVSVERWNESTGFDPGAYEAFLRKAEEIFGDLGIKVTRIARGPAGPSNRPPPPSTTPSALYVVAAIALVAVGLVAGLLIAHR